MNCKYETYKGKCGLKGSMAYKRKCCTKECCRCWELMSNGDNIRTMSNAELAREILFFCPTDAVFGDNKPHYTGLDGKYYLTADETAENSLKWLDMTVEDTQ